MTVAGQALVLLGAPCAGKTSLAKAFQDQVPGHFLRLSLDTYFAGVSERWAGGPVGPHRAEGFEYVRGPERDGHADVRIEYGEVGWRILQGMHASVAAFVQAGNDVVFDDMPLDARALLDWRRALAGVNASAVLLEVPLDVAERREQARQPKMHGLARGHFDLSTEVSDVDLRLDGTMPLEHLAQELVHHVACRRTRPAGITLGVR